MKNKYILKMIEFTRTDDFRKNATSILASNIELKKVDRLINNKVKDFNKHGAKLVCIGSSQFYRSFATDGNELNSYVIFEYKSI